MDTVKEEINYRLVFKRLEKRYPHIALELCKSQRELDKFEMLRAYTLFCRVKGICHITEHNADISNLRALFVAVMVKIYDDDFFEVEKKNLRKGLRKKISSLANCTDNTQISHILINVRTYLKVYKDFNKEVEYIYSEIMKAL